jgi:O-succinylbenzoate synthase
MIVERVELALLRLPYVHFFETSLGRESERTFIIVRVYARGICGFGEVVASEAPLYSSETNATAWHVLKDFLIPLVFEKGIARPEDFSREARKFRGHQMAKAGLELALWDLLAKEEGIPLWKVYGGTKSEIPSGVSCGIEDSIPELLERIDTYLAEGYRRIKIKIKPGWDIDVCREVRRRFPTILLQVDANGAYSLADIKTLKALDEFHLLMIEQPFPPPDLWNHNHLQKELQTDVCLDESIDSGEAARQALEIGSCRVINIKVGRVGGIVEARRIHDLCRDRGVPVWCGGMLESGIGRAHNLHLASLPNFRLPHDLSASRRYYAQDLIEPMIELQKNGTIRVPEGPGIGVFPQEDRIRRALLKEEAFSPRASA